MDKAHWIALGLLLTALVLLWWQQRVRLAELRRRMALNEDARARLERYVEALDVRLTQASTERLPEGDGTRAAAPRAGVDAPAPAPGWADTQPFVEPEEVIVQLSPAPARLPKVSSRPR